MSSFKNKFTISPLSSNRSFMNNQTDKKLGINPLWLTGFLNGEGCFFISIYKNKNKISWAIKPEFQFGLHIKDKVLLEEIKNYL